MSAVKQRDIEIKNKKLDAAKRLREELAKKIEEAIKEEAQAEKDLKKLIRQEELSRKKAWGEHAGRIAMETLHQRHGIIPLEVLTAMFTRLADEYIPPAENEIEAIEPEMAATPKIESPDEEKSRLDDAENPGNGKSDDGQFGSGDE